MDSYQPAPRTVELVFEVRPSAKTQRCPICGRRIRPNQEVAALGGVPGLGSDPDNHVLVHRGCVPSWVPEVL